MKPLFILLLLAASHSIFAQQKPKAPIGNFRPGQNVIELSVPRAGMSRKELQSFFNHQLDSLGRFGFGPRAGSTTLSQDRMPNVVPDTAKGAFIPNAFGKPVNPFRSQIPNPAFPK